MQLKYEQTTHMQFIRGSFAYTRISICVYIHVHMHIYISLFCIPISFFISCIVGKTKDISGYQKAPGFKVKFVYC